MKKSKYRLYEKDEKRWVQYDEESYKKMKRWRNSFCAKKRYDEACFCPKDKQWMCNTICSTCPFAKTEIQFSKPIAGTDDLTVEDKLSDGIDIEMHYIQAEEAEKILSRLDELMPKGREIVRLRWQGYSWEEIETRVKITRKTIRKKLKETLGILMQEFEELQKK